MSVGTRERTKEGAWLSLGGDRMRADQRGLLDVAASQLRLHLSRHVN